MTDRREDDPGGDDAKGAADDPAALAQRFTDLWRENLSAMAGDPAVAAGMAQSMAAWSQMTGLSPLQNPMASPAHSSNPAPSSNTGQPGSAGPASPLNDWMNLAQSWTQMMQRAAEGPLNANAQPASPPSATTSATTSASSSQTSGAQSEASGSTPDGSERLLRELTQRFHDLEQRIATLESNAQASSGRASDKDQSSPPAEPRKSRARKGARKSATKRPPAKS